MQNHGTHALAIQYGPFAEVGMAAKHVDALSSVGMHPLRPQEVHYPHTYDRIAHFTLPHNYVGL